FPGWVLLLFIFFMAKYISGGKTKGEKVRKQDRRTGRRKRFSQTASGSCSCQPASATSPNTQSGR
ncbi:MAG TPA: hypothetical protein VI731_11960, partial [Bacteroidia bacterium]|nr:hypothetical protein [Bacteroidia bacterium]